MSRRAFEGIGGASEIIGLKGAGRASKEPVNDASWAKILDLSNKKRLTYFGGQTDQRAQSLIEMWRRIYIVTDLNCKYSVMICTVDIPFPHFSQKRY